MNARRYRQPGPLRLMMAGFALFALAACGEEEAAPPLPPRPVVSEIVSAVTGARATFVGEVAARVETDLAFPVLGRIAERRADRGVQVQAGDVLARLDPTTLDADLRNAEGGVAVARARLKSAQDSTDRTRALVARNASSATDLETAEQALVAAQARLEQAMATLATARDLVGYATMTAPQAGVISAVFAEAGATVAAGQAVLRLAATEEREVVIDLTEQQLAGLAVGALFDVRLEADAGVTAQAVLASVDPVAERATRTRRLHLRLETPPVGFRLGALVRVAAVGDQAEAVPTLPETAVMEDGTVWVVSRPPAEEPRVTGTLARVPVTRGSSAGGRVAIMSGLAAGDEVVIKGIHSLAEGQIVGRQVLR